MSQSPSVSAVIPTIGRPELRSAVESVLAQTYGIHEVVIGADTADDLDLPNDPRVKVVRTGPRAGGNVARMAAIRAASGDLIALLDDDDAWAPRKLQRQLARIDTANPTGQWLSATLVTDEHGRVWPERRLQSGERLADYLFRKSRLKAGQGALHTSTLLFPRALVLEHSFDEHLRFHQDIDWLIRVDNAVQSLPCIQVDEALTMLGVGDGSISRGIQPLESLAWARRSLGHLSRRTRGDFLMTVTYFQACRHSDVGAAFQVVRDALFWGRPGLKTLPSIVLLPIKVARIRKSRSRASTPAPPRISDDART